MIAQRVFLLVMLAAAASSCAFWRDDENPCESSEEYQQAHVAADIQVPAGLAAPESAGRLAIPAGPVAEKPLADNAACLQRPPNYFDKPLRTAPAD